MRILFFPSRRDGWVAVMLDHCLMAQASTRDELPDELLRVIASHSRECIKRGLPPVVCMPPAPSRYADKWDGAKATELAAPGIVGEWRLAAEPPLPQQRQSGGRAGSHP